LEGKKKSCPTLDLIVVWREGRMYMMAPTQIHIVGYGIVLLALLLDHN